MTEEQSLLAAIRADPNDNALRLAFADWLDEHDQPERAAWVRDVEIFWWMGPDYASPLPQILDRLRHEDPDERDKAGPVVERLRGAATPLLREAFATGDEDLRRGIAEIFAWVRDGVPRPLPELITDVRSGDLNSVRLALIELGWHGAEAAPAVPALIDAWQQWAEEDHPYGVAPGIATLIAGPLEQLGPAAIAAAPVLISELGPGSLSRVALNVLVAMGPAVVGRVGLLLGHLSAWTRYGAASVLLRIQPDSTRAITVLQELQNHLNDQVRSAAREVLRSHGIPVR